MSSNEWVMGTPEGANLDSASGGDWGQGGSSAGCCRRLFLGASVFLSDSLVDRHS